MRKKQLLALPVPAVPENDMQDYTVEEERHSWSRTVYVVNKPNYIYTANIDNSTGERVLIVDLYRPSGVHIYRLFTTKTQWFRRWTFDGHISAAGMDHTMFPGGDWARRDLIVGFGGADETIAKYIGRILLYGPEATGLAQIARLHSQVKEEALQEKYRKIRERVYAEMRHLRPIPKGISEWIKKDLMKEHRYLWADYGKKKTMQAVCSHCGKSVTIPHLAEESKYKCPNCKTECTVKSQKRHERNYGPEEKKYFVWMQDTPDGYCERFFEVTWTFRRGAAQVDEFLYETNRAFYVYDELRDDFVRANSYRCDNFYNSGVKEWIRGGSDFIRSYVYPGNLDRLFRKQKRFRAYHAKVGEIARCSGRIIASYLYHAVQNVKVLQNCVDAGLYRLAHDLIDMTHRDDKDKDKILDNRYGSLRKALQIGKDDIPFLREADPEADDLLLYRRFRREGRPIDPQTFRFFCDNLSHYVQEKMLNMPLTIAAQIKYLSAQNYPESWNGNAIGNAASDWFDYIANARLLRYDLSDRTVLMPKNLKYAHDMAYEIVRSIDKKDGYRFPQIEEQESGYNRMYGYTDSRCFIRAPRDHDEIIAEGAALHHCVSTYAKRVASGETVILFVRKKDDPDTPYFTLNIDPVDGHMIQCRGLKNCGMTPEVKRIVDALLLKLQGRKETA